MWRFLGLLIMVAGAILVILWGAGVWPLDAGSERRAVNGERPGSREKNKDEAPLPLGKPTRQAPAPEKENARPDELTVTDTVLTRVNETEIGSRIDGRVIELLVQPGHKVVKDQILMKLDDAVAQKAVLRQQKKFESGKFRIDAANAAFTYYTTERQRTYLAKEAGTAVERSSADAQLARSTAEVQVARYEKEIDEIELSRMEEELQFHYIRSNRDGVVVQIFNNKRVGEQVRAGEPLFKVASDELLRAEGSVDAHLAPQIRPGMKAYVEPEIPLGAFKTLRLHTAGVTDLAVTPDGRLLASASKDHDVFLWHWRLGELRGKLAHAPDEVFAVACGGMKPGEQGHAAYTFATGCGNSRAVLWQITTDAAGRVLERKSTDLKDGHRNRLPVRAVAFSEDGLYLATGGDDDQICLWDVESGKLLYRVRESKDENEPAHRGDVTALCFTKDNQLISASTDKVFKKWRLDKSWAVLAGTQKDRSAQVSRFGLTADGSRVLFDYGNELRLLDTSNDWLPLGSLRNQRQGHFQNLAVLSPAGRLALTVGAGRLQLWAVPMTPEAAAAAPEQSPWLQRAYEVRQLVVPDPGKVTCGAFYVPEEMGLPAGDSFAFTGSDDGLVQVWRLPPAAERQEPIEAVITYVGTQVERGGAGLLQIRADLKNPIEKDGHRRLLAGRRVNLMIIPESVTAK